MNLNRYLIAGALSLTLHSAMLWSAPENHSSAMPVGSKSNSVSVNFMKAPAEPVVETKTKTQPPEKVKQVEKIKPKAKPVTKAKPHPVESDVKKKKTVIPKEQTPVVSKAPEPETVEKKVVEQKEPKPQSEEVEPKKIIEPKIKQQASADAKAGVTDIPQLVSESRFANTPQPPSYPRLAKRKGIEGTAVYEVWLDDQGQQIKMQLKDSSGTKMLDKAAAKAIAQWQFLPYKVNGQAVAHRVYVPIKFKLD